MSYRFMRKLNDVSLAVSVVTGFLEKSLRQVEISIDEALGFYSSETIRSHIDVPPYNRAVVDGCAVNSSDLGGASPESPVILRRKGVSYAGDEGVSRINRSECLEVATGAPIPEGADTVVPAEYVIDLGNEMVGVVREFNIGYGVSVKGEDLRKGDIVIEQGTRIAEHHLAMLSSLGIPRIKIWKLPRLGVFSTGNEIVEPGSRRDEHKVYDSTRRIVKGFLKRLGFTEIIDKGIVPDDEQAIMDTFIELINEADIIISTGGTSVGKKDHTIRVLEKLNPTSYMHGFALTPGRPFAVGILSNKLLLTLSGMPVAALTELMAVLEPALSKALGRRKRIIPMVKGILLKKLSTHPGMLNYVRAKLYCNEQGKIVVEPLRLTGSGILSTLRDGGAVIIVPPEITGYNEGEVVDVLLYDPEKLGC